MSAQVEAQAPPPPARPTLRERLTRNPVILKELRGRMRGARAFVTLSVYLLLMGGLVGMFYLFYTFSASNPYSGFDRQWLGRFVFWVVTGLELIFVCFMAPAFTVGAISGERERQTFDLLRTTLLSPGALVLGKLGSALLFVFLLLIAALPLQSLALLLGGVAPEEVLIASLMLLVTAFLYGSAGVFFSALMRRTLGATVLAYGFALLDTIGLPVMLLALVPVISVLDSMSTPPLVAQAALLYGFGLAIATNPLATAIATEIILVEQHTVFYFSTSLSGANGTAINAPLISPWLLYVVFGLLLGLAMAAASVHLVSRPERM